MLFQRDPDLHGLSYLMNVLLSFLKIHALEHLLFVIDLDQGRLGKSLESALQYGCVLIFPLYACNSA